MKPRRSFGLFFNLFVGLFVGLFVDNSSPYQLGPDGAALVLLGYWRMRWTFFFIALRLLRSLLRF